jgi:hypothetical protein
VNRCLKGADLEMLVRQVVVVVVVDSSILFN